MFTESIASMYLLLVVVLGVVGIATVIVWIAFPFVVWKKLNEIIKLMKGGK